MREPPLPPAAETPAGHPSDDERGPLASGAADSVASADGGHKHRHVGTCGPECYESPPPERWMALAAPLDGTEELLPYDPDRDDEDGDP